MLENDDKAQGRDRYDLDFRKIHEIIRPADVRANDRVEARVRIGGNPEDIPMRVWRMSALGVELVVDGNQLKKGDDVDLELLIAGQRLSFDGVIVDLVQESDRITLAGIRFHRTENNSYDGTERRSVMRWRCAPEYYPTAVCPTPGHISDHMYFRILNISRNGMQLLCSLRNKVVLPGITLPLTCNFGWDGTFHAPVQVTRVGFANEGGRDQLVIGVKFSSLTPRMRSIIGQYLIQFSTSATLSQLRDQGLWPESVSTAVNFLYLSTNSEYSQVKELRRKAHQADSNLNEGVSADDMGDRYDGDSRIIIGKHRERVVCTVRVYFNKPEGKLEHDELIDWPEYLPDRNEIIELSRLAIDPEYRHGDLMLGLFEFIAATCTQQHPYALISCLEKMIPFFEKIGFSKTGLTYHSKLFRDTGHVMLGDIHPAIKGRNVGPMYWNLVWRRAAEFLIDAQVINPTGIDKLRIAFYRRLAPIAKLLRFYKTRRSLRT